MDDINFAENSGLKSILKLVHLLRNSVQAHINSTLRMGIVVIQLHNYIVGLRIIQVTAL